MGKLYSYRVRIDNDNVTIYMRSSEIEELATRVQDSLDYWRESDALLKMDVFGLIEATARKKARAEIEEQGLNTSPSYFKTLKDFYANLIKDELLRRLV